MLVKTFYSPPLPTEILKIKIKKNKKSRVGVTFLDIQINYFLRIKLSSKPEKDRENEI